MSKLTNRQKKFIEEYFKDFNATQAAMRAGYSHRTAQVQGSRLLSIVMVREKINSEINETIQAQKKMLVRASDAAIKALVEIIENGKGVARVQAANSILDRAGHKVTDQLLSEESENLNSEIGVEDAKQQFLQDIRRLCTENEERS